jgi:hypothetical protein
MNKKFYKIICFLIFAEIVFTQHSSAQIRTNDTPILISFSDSIFIESPVIMNFFRQYLFRYRDTINYKYIPIILCQINSYSDTLFLTLSGYDDYHHIYGSPNAYIKFENKVILMDFGIGRAIDSTKNTTNLLSKLNIGFNHQHVNGEVYFFPAWQLKIFNKCNYIIKKGIRPPGSPPLPELSDTINVHYSIPKK